VDFYDLYPTIEIEDYDQMREDAAGFIEKLK